MEARVTYEDFDASSTDEGTNKVYSMAEDYPADRIPAPVIHIIDSLGLPRPVIDHKIDRGVAGYVRIDDSTGQIYINAKLSPKQLTDTLLHEMGHVFDAKIADSEAPFGKRMIPATEAQKQEAIDVVDRLIKVNPQIQEELLVVTTDPRLGRGAIREGTAIYRTDPRELYADFFRAMMLNPRMTMAKAPTAYDAFVVAIGKFNKPLQEHMIRYQRILEDPEELGKAVVSAMGRGGESGITTRLKSMAEGQKQREKSLFTYAGLALNRFHAVENTINRALGGDIDMARNEEWSYLRNLRDKVFGFSGEENFVISSFQAINNEFAKDGLSPDQAQALLNAWSAAGPRRKVMNPGGGTASSLKPILDDIVRTTGNQLLRHKYGVWSEVNPVHQLQEVNLKVLDYMVSSGTLSPAQRKKIVDASKGGLYVTTIEEFRIAGGELTPKDVAELKKGTLQGVGNYMGETGMKLRAAVRAADINLAMRDMLDVITRLPESESYVSTARKPGYKEITYRRSGAPVSVWMAPDHAIAFTESLKSPIVPAMLKKIGVGTDIAKKLYTIYNLKFVLWNNPIRDTIEAVRSIVSIFGKDSKPIIMKALKYYVYNKNPLTDKGELFGTTRLGLKYAEGKTPSQVGGKYFKEMLDNAVIPHPTESFYRSLGDSPNEAYLKSLEAAYRKNPDGSRTLTERGAAAIKKMLNRYEEYVQALEVTVKMAWYQALRESGVSANIAANIVRNVVGTPNWRVKGVLNNSVANLAFPYLNIFAQGVGRNVEIMLNKNTRGTFLGFLAGSLMLTAYQIYLAETTEEGAAHWILTPRAQFVNNIMVPMGVGIGRNGPVAQGINIPSDDFTKLVRSIIYAAYEEIVKYRNTPEEERTEAITQAYNVARNMFGGLLDSASDTLPSVNPFASVGYVWGNFALDRNSTAGLGSDRVLFSERDTTTTKLIKSMWFTFSELGLAGAGIWGINPFPNVPKILTQEGIEDMRRVLPTAMQEYAEALREYLQRGEVDSIIDYFPQSYRNIYFKTSAGLKERIANLGRQVERKQTKARARAMSDAASQDLERQIINIADGKYSSTVLNSVMDIIGQPQAVRMLLDRDHDFRVRFLNNAPPIIRDHFMSNPEFVESMVAGYNRSLDQEMTKRTHPLLQTRKKSLGFTEDMLRMQNRLESDK